MKLVLLKKMLFAIFITLVLCGTSYAALPSMVSPEPNTHLSSDIVTFNWSAGSYSDFYLDVGTTYGGTEIYSEYTTDLSLTVSGLPTNGSQIYTTLWYWDGFDWQYVEPYSYMASSAGLELPAMTSPEPQTQLGSDMVTFSWSAGSYSEFSLFVGTTYGASDIYYNGNTAETSLEVTGFPTDGSPVYVTLFYWDGMDWQNIEPYSYMASGAGAELPVMITPEPNTQLSSDTVTFTWSSSSYSEFSLFVGTTYGASDIYYNGNTAETSLEVTGLPTDGSPVYVTLFYWDGMDWQDIEPYSYMASGSGVELPVMITPEPNTQLSSDTVTFNWSAGSYSDFYLDVGTTYGGTEIYSEYTTDLSLIVTGLPSDGSIVYVTLWYWDGVDWQYVESYYYKASGSGAELPVMITPEPNTQLSSDTVTFTWSSGSYSEFSLFVGTTYGASDIYYNGNTAETSLEVTGLPTDGSPVYVTLFYWDGMDWQNIEPCRYMASGSGAELPAMTSPESQTQLGSDTVTFTWSSGSYSEFYFNIGTTYGGTEIYSEYTTDLSLSITGLPTDGSPVYVTLNYWDGIDWQYVEPSSYKTSGSGAELPVMITPEPNTQLGSDTVTFTWSSGNYSEFYFYIGTTYGGTEIYSEYTTDLSISVTGLPTDGSPVYVTHYYWDGIDWQYVEPFSYMASGSDAELPAMITPEPNTQFSSDTVTFNWSAGSYSEFYLDVGTTYSGTEIYSEYTTELSLTVTGLPSDGSPVYVTLYYWDGIDWQYVDPYEYSASGVLNEDVDNDEISDEWEQQIIDADSDDNIITIDDVDPLGDFDGDLFSNLREYQEGTDPTDTDSKPENTTPIEPSLNYPIDMSEVDSQEPILSVNNATDADEHSLTYTFEVYSDEELTQLIASSSGITEEENTTQWNVNVELAENTLYYWTVVANDGIEDSVSMDTAMFFVNTINDSPTIPGISSPPHQSEVTTLQPVLEVTNSVDADHDTVTYNFALYSDEAGSVLVTSVTGVFEENSGITFWQVDTSLDDDTTYYWQVQAFDEHGASSELSSLVELTVDTSENAPSVPSIDSPENSEDVTTLTPSLQINNSTDLDGDALTYYFEIDNVGTYDSASLELSLGIDEDAEGITSWSPLPLTDNTFYYFRVRAYDGGTYSAWGNGSFFVNLSNDAPSMPLISSPADNSEVTALSPVLGLNASSDVDLDDITYNYEVYSDDSLISLVTSTISAGVSWAVDMSLANHETYYWRARAVDEHGAGSSWTDLVSFTVNTNYNPTAPTLNNPISGGSVSSLTPTLSVNNSVDPDGDALSYEFELYSDRDLTSLVASGAMIQGDIITSWVVSTSLTDGGTTYYWRARAFDGALYSSWMSTAVFVVNTSGPETSVIIEASQNMTAESLSVQTVEVSDNTSSISGVIIEVPAGALSADCTITIGVVTNPPALPENTKAIGRVIEFGPEGLTFAVPVSIKIPYTQADLDDAGVSDPSELEIFTYNTSTLTWEKINVEEVDTANRLLVCKVNHFSMYTTGITVTNSSPGGNDPPVDQNLDQTQPVSDSGGGGGCFISISKGAITPVVSIVILFFTGLSLAEVKRNFKI